MAKRASCGDFGVGNGWPKKGRKATMPATATIMALARTAAVATSAGSDATASAPSYFSSLAMKPRNGGKPAMDKAATAAAIAAMGIARARPRSRSASRVPVP